MAGLSRLTGRKRPGGPLTTTGLVVVAGLIVVLAFGQQYVGSVLVLAFTYGIVTTGMAVQIGFSQQIAFSQSVFMGLGAYGAAMLNTHLNLPTLAAAPIVVVGSGLAGPAARVGGHPGLGAGPGRGDDHASAHRHRVRELGRRTWAGRWACRWPATCGRPTRPSSSRRATA